MLLSVMLVTLLNTAYANPLSNLLDMFNSKSKLELSFDKNTKTKATDAASILENIILEKIGPYDGHKINVSYRDFIKTDETTHQDIVRVDVLSQLKNVKRNEFSAVYNADDVTSQDITEFFEGAGPINDAIALISTGKHIQKGQTVDFLERVREEIDGSDDVNRYLNTQFPNKWLYYTSIPNQLQRPGPQPPRTRRTVFIFSYEGGNNIIEKKVIFSIDEDSY